MVLAMRTPLSALAMGVFVLICVVPLLAGLGYSLLYSLGLTGLLSEGFTLAHWGRLLTLPETYRSLGYTLALTLGSLVIILALTLAFSWWHFQREPLGLLQPVLLLPLLFAPVVAAFAWYYLLSPGGLLSRLAFHLGWVEGLEQFPRLVNDAGSVGILVVHAFLIFPLFALLFLHQIHQERLPELREVALTLGSRPGQFFRQVFAPLLLRRTRPFIVLYGIFLLGAYEVPLLLGRSSPRTATIFITERLSGYQLADIPLAHAMALLFSLLIMGLARRLMPRHPEQVTGL